jgi:hypothetical protein
MNARICLFGEMITEGLTTFLLYRSHVQRENLNFLLHLLSIMNKQLL